MGGLVDEDAASFAGPGAAPGIGGVVFFIAPAVHGDGGEDRFSDFSAVDGGADALAGWVEAALADGADFGAAFIGGGDDAVAIFEGGGEGFFDEEVDAAFCEGDGGVGVLGVRGADAEGFDAGFASHFFGLGIGFDVVFFSEGAGAFGIGAADGGELGFGKCEESGGVDVGDFSAADDAGFYFLHGDGSIKRVAG